MNRKNNERIKFFRLVAGGSGTEHAMLSFALLTLPGKGPGALLLGKNFPR